MATEIIINASKIIDAEEKLKQLQKNIGNRKLNVTFSSSKGDTVDNLSVLADRMKALKNNLALLYGNTANALAATRNSFNETDNSVANYFSTFWERIDEE